MQRWIWSKRSSGHPTQCIHSTLPVPQSPNPQAAISFCLVLDSVDVRYMKTVDNFNNKLISAFITAGSTLSHLGIWVDLDIKLMLLHESRNDDGIRAFFNDVWECYVKTLLNPFYAVDKGIKSSVFENRVRGIAKVLPKRFLEMLMPAISITYKRPYSMHSEIYTPIIVP